MQHHFDNVQDQYGNAVGGVSVLVSLTSSGARATVYSDNGVNAKTNPLTTSATGGFDFYAANGDYTLTVTHADGTTSLAYATLFDINDVNATAIGFSQLAASTGSSLIGWMRSAVGAIATTLAKRLGWQTANAFEFMTDAQIADVQAGTALLDVTAAIKSAHAASRSVHYPRGTYKILLTEGQYLFKGTSGRYRFTGDDALILDTSTYTKDGAFTQIFWVDATDALTVDGINYQGPAIPTPTVNHGYIGASFVRATTGAKNITVNAHVENARHGIHSGDYSTPALGYCEHFRGNLVCKFVGYPLALYLPRDVEMSVYGEATHRCAYLAGAQHVRLDAKFKDQYIAPVQVLLTDAKTGTGTSEGCRDVIASATDMGSTTSVTNSWCAGIAMSRVDPGTVFQDIAVDVYVRGDDATASTLGAFVVISGANVYEPSYAFNWEQTIYLRNIKLSGTIDRSQQTLDEHGVGEVYFYPLDTGTHFATVQGLDVRNLHYLPGSGTKVGGFRFFMPGLIGPAKFDNSYFGTASPFYYATNATSSGMFSNCTLRGTYDATSDSPYLSAATFICCTIANQAYQPFTNKAFVNTNVQGAGAQIKYAMTELTLAGASVTWAGALPNQSIILGLGGYVTQTITGATGYQVGDGTTVARFVDSNGIAVASTWSVSNGTDTTPKVQIGAGNVIVTAKTSNFTGGKLRLIVSYIQLSAPTS